jgi:hypothetical protein
MACVVLHNFLGRNHGTQYTPGSMLDREDLEDVSVVEGNWRNEKPQGSFDMLRRESQVTLLLKLLSVEISMLNTSMVQASCHSITEWWATEYYGNLTLVYFK